MRLSDKADNLAKGFKHSDFAVRAGCFGRSVGRFNEHTAGVAFDFKFPHFDFGVPIAV